MRTPEPSGSEYLPRLMLPSPLLPPRLPAWSLPPRRASQQEDWWQRRPPESQPLSRVSTRRARAGSRRRRRRGGGEEWLEGAAETGVRRPGREGGRRGRENRVTLDEGGRAGSREVSLLCARCWTKSAIRFDFCADVLSLPLCEISQYRGMCMLSATWSSSLPFSGLPVRPTWVLLKTHCPPFLPRLGPALGPGPSSRAWLSPSLGEGANPALGRSNARVPGPAVRE